MMYTLKTASRKAGVSDRTIRNWIAKGKLIAKKEGSRWFVDDSSLGKVGNIVSVRLVEVFALSRSIDACCPDIWKRQL